MNLRFQIFCDNMNLTEEERRKIFGEPAMPQDSLADLKDTLEEIKAIAFANQEKLNRLLQFL